MRWRRGSFFLLVLPLFSSCLPCQAMPYHEPPSIRGMGSFYRQLLYFNARDRAFFHSMLKGVRNGTSKSIVCDFSQTRVQDLTSLSFPLLIFELFESYRARLGKPMESSIRVHNMWRLTLTELLLTKFFY